MKQDWGDIRDELRERLAAVNAEIGAYPSPITGCDAQFNHLLERQAGIKAELARLDAAMKRGADEDTIRRFIESCLYLSGPPG